MSLRMQWSRPLHLLWLRLSARLYQTLPLLWAYSRNMALRCFGEGKQHVQWQCVWRYRWCRYTKQSCKPRSQQFSHVAPRLVNVSWKLGPCRLHGSPCAEDSQDVALSEALKGWAGRASGALYQVPAVKQRHQRSADTNGLCCKWAPVGRLPALSGLSRCKHVFGGSIYTGRLLLVLKMVQNRCAIFIPRPLHQTKDTKLPGLSPALLVRQRCCWMLQQLWWRCQQPVCWPC